MARGHQAGGPPASLALLHAIARRDLPAVKRALAAGADLEWKGIAALHVCALCDWSKAVPLLLSHGADLDATLDPMQHAGVVVARLEALGIAPEDQCAAVLPLHSPKTPLALAVRCGSAAVATALLAAGADDPAGDAFGQLLELARWKAKQLGREVAADVVPALVQQCAAALLTVPLHAAALAAAHVAAAQLAFLHLAGPRLPHCPPDYWGPACPWLLKRLLQLHIDGHFPAAAGAVWAVCQALLGCAECAADLRSFCDGYDGHDQDALVAALAAWLSLPAASDLPSSSVASLFKDLCKRGAAGALPALVKLPAMREALRAEAERPLVVDEAAAGDAAALVCAVASKCGAALLDAVLAAGGAVTINAVRSAVARTAANVHDWSGLHMLQLLLSRGRPPVPRDAALFEGPGADRYAYLACPLYLALDVFNIELDELARTLVEEADNDGIPPVAGTLNILHGCMLQAVELLVEAGYRISTFDNYPVERDVGGGEEPETALATFCPGEDAVLAGRWELGSSGRWLWLAARREPWSVESHASFPPAFKQAARTLLLAAHRGVGSAGAAQQRGSRRSAGRARTRASKARQRGAPSGAASAADAATGAAQLARLPRELLHAILAQAAYPVSAWRPQMDGGRALATVRAWQPPSESEEEDAYSDEEGFSDADEEFSDSDAGEWGI